MFAFSKNERDCIAPDELQKLKNYAVELRGMSDDKIEFMLQVGVIEEVANVES
jgi:hypothetical protein